MNRIHPDRSENQESSSPAGPGGALLVRGAIRCIRVIRFIRFIRFIRVRTITIEPASGGYTATMSSSMTRDVLFRTVTVTGNAVTLETRTPASAFVVRLRIDGSTVTGDWTMGAQTGVLRGTRRGAGG
jgi:hypothetical protein